MEFFFLCVCEERGFMKHIILLALPILFASCTEVGEDAMESIPYQSNLVNKQGKTLQERFKTPDGYERVGVDAFGKYLRNLPLKPHGSMVHYYDGKVKDKPGVYEAVVHMDIGKQNLQQCADAIMRLRAEYLLAAGEADKIHFNFTNGFNAEYAKWRQGYRIAINGNSVSWTKRANVGDSYTSFRSYMDVVFSYAGTMSLSKELKPVAYAAMQPGDVFIIGGSPGHAVIVVDMAKNRAGKKLYMLAQSYMPAQDIQILCNPNNKDLSPWYELDESVNAVITPEWDFTAGDLKRFE
jgi:hypothetical protein